jgi:hypothetical protein
VAGAWSSGASTTNPKGINMPRKKRDYKAEYAEYQGKPEQIHNRSLRNQARRKAAKSGMDIAGKDVGHVVALSKGGSNSTGLKAQTKGTNRSFARNADGSMKSETSKRERKKK